TPPRLPFAKRPWLSRSLFDASAVAAPFAPGGAPFAPAWDALSTRGSHMWSTKPHDAAFTVWTTLAIALPSSSSTYLSRRAPAASARAKLSRCPMVLSMMLSPSFEPETAEPERRGAQHARGASSAQMYSNMPEAQNDRSVAGD